MNIIELMENAVICLNFLFKKVDIPWFKVSSFTKIRPQEKIDNFAFKNSNIIIEGEIWKRKDYFSWKKF